MEMEDGNENENENEFFFKIKKKKSESEGEADPRIPRFSLSLSLRSSFLIRVVLPSVFVTSMYSSSEASAASAWFRISRVYRGFMPEGLSGPEDIVDLKDRGGSYLRWDGMMKRC